MILTAEEYAKKYGCSSKTIKRKIKEGNLPSNHIGVKKSNGYMIEVKEL